MPPAKDLEAGSRPASAPAAEEIEPSPDELTALLDVNRKRTESSTDEPRKYGIIDRMFKKDKNSRFADDLEMAVRAATYITLAGLPFLFKEGTLPTADWLVKHGFYSPSSIVMYVYVLYRSVGETINYAWCGTVGVLIATLNSLVMFWVYPGGVTETGPESVWWAGIGNAVLFTVTILWLNMDILTQIFALCSFVWLWMAFMDPRPDHVSQGFTIHTTGIAMTGLLTSMVGCGLAIITTLAPTPVWAMKKAQDRGWETVGMLSSTWAIAADIYCSEHRQKTQMGVLVKDMERLQAHMGLMEAHIQHAWWECFGSGPRQQRRMMLSRLDRALQDNYDRLFFVLNCCKDESFAKVHVELMRSMKPHVHRVLAGTKDLMNISTQAACAGKLVDEHKPAAQDAILELTDSIRKLTAEFKEAKKGLKLPDISEELVDEHTFCIYVCASGRLAIRFTEDLLGHQDGSQPLPSVEEASGLASIFDRTVLFDPGHVSFVLRNSVSIFIGLGIGCYGLSAMLSPYQAGVASTNAILLSKFMGSAIAKNLERLQGVVLGTVVGQMVHSCLGWCTHWWNPLAVGAAIWLWLAISLFTYFNSVKFSGMACLLAAFGTSNMLMPCHRGDFSPEGTYYKIINNVVAIFVMILADFCAARGEKASEMSYIAYLKCWDRLTKILEVHLNVEKPATRHHKGKLMRELQLAESLGMEAAEEPRYWRSPWRKASFAHACEAGRRLRISITGLEYCVAEEERDGAPKDKLFVAMLQMPSFNDIGRVLLETMGRVEKFLPVFVQSQDSMEVFNDKTVWKDDRIEMLVAVQKFVADANQQSLAGLETPKRGLSKDSLEFDSVSRVSLILDSIDTIMKELMKLKDNILRD